jgi:hypothetical protein
MSGKEQKEEDIDHRIDEKPCQQHELPFRGLFWVHGQR